MDQDLHILEFDRIIDMLCGLAVSDRAKKTLEGLRPTLNEAVCRSRMRETTEARRVLDAFGAPPLAVMTGLEETLDTAGRGGMLMPAQLSGVAVFCASVRALARYYGRAREVSPVTASRQAILPDLTGLEERIDASVREDEILDDASQELRQLRRSRERKEQEIRDKLEQVIRLQKHQLTDGYATIRNGHYVLPVQKKFRGVFPGKEIETSSKGSTVFMEPASIGKLTGEMDTLLAAADAEERRILWELTDRTAGMEAEIRGAIREMTEADVLFAKAKLSAAMRAREAEMTGERRIRLISARHPLLDEKQCVPLELRLEPPFTGIAVTGPNTGGKTVALKTLGLLCRMAQCGLHVPCGEGTVLPLTDGVYCDIGDSQSITQNLSTFSGHMLEMIRILKECSRDSLVLLDEPGSGTDPAEGSGIAVAVLEELVRRKCLFMTTTHDPRVKRWSERNERVIPARMAFDRESLKPLFRLEMGLSGESCALEIAGRLGLDERLLKRARRVTEGDGEDETAAACEEHAPIPASRLRRETALKEECAFEKGDSVALLPERTNAIVFGPADERGNIIIHMQGRFLTVNRKRLQLLVPARELYPENYDFAILFDTVENRKAAHSISRKNDPGAVVVYREGRKD